MPALTTHTNLGTEWEWSEDPSTSPECNFTTSLGFLFFLCYSSNSLSHSAHLISKNLQFSLLYRSKGPKLGIHQRDNKTVMSLILLRAWYVAPVVAAWSSSHLHGPLKLNLLSQVIRCHTRTQWWWFLKVSTRLHLCWNDSVLLECRAPDGSGFKCKSGWVTVHFWGLPFCRQATL